METTRLSPEENVTKFALGDKLTEHASQFFSDNGFAVFERVFSQPEIDRIVQEVNRVLASLGPDHPDLSLGVDKNGKVRRGTIANLARHSEYIGKLAQTDTRLLTIAKLCPGVGRYLEEYRSGVIFMEKGRDPNSAWKGLAWHDDSYVAGLGFGRVLVVQIYLDQSTQANGAIRVVPASHHFDRSIPMPSGLDVHPDEVAVVANAGDVTAHITGLWHCSPPGWISGPAARRRALQLAFCERFEQGEVTSDPTSRSGSANVIR